VIWIVASYALAVALGAGAGIYLARQLIIRSAGTHSYSLGIRATSYRGFQKRLKHRLMHHEDVHQAMDAIVEQAFQDVADCDEESEAM